ncbi:MAG: glycosyltransferase, partial [Prevotella sp.]|nr:glycosyltransferase [Candidatus Prevotella equi]
MNAPLISFIVPAYNAGASISDCLDSIYCLDMCGYGREIIVVNDGSTDNTAEILAAYVRENSVELTVITQENKGLSCARNAAMDVARGIYLCFVDSDDVLLTDSFPLEILAEHGYDIVGFNMLKIDGKGNSTPYRRYRYSYGKVYEPAATFMKGRNLMPCVCAYIFRRQMLTEAGLSFIPHIYHEDEDFTARAFAAAQSFVAVNVAFYGYRANEDSITPTLDTRKQEWKLRDLVSILRGLHQSAMKDERFRECTQYKMDYLAVDTLRLLLRMKHSQIFRNE